MNEILIKIRNNPPLLSIGKKGLSNQFINELEQQIKKNKLVKIKILKNSPFKNRKEVFEALKAQINSIELVEVRGWTLIVARKE